MKKKAAKKLLEHAPEFDPFDIPPAVANRLCKLAAQAYLSNMVSFLQQKGASHIDTAVITSFGEVASLRIFLLGCNSNPPKKLN